MHSHLLLVLSVITSFSRSVAGLSLFNNGLTKELQLSALLGLDPDLLLKNQRVFHSLVSESRKSTTIPTEYVTIPIDHNNASVGTYSNRFWVNAEHYSPGGPVFLYDGGESNAESSTAHLISDSSFFKSLLREFKAIGIVWEHRYYGQSLPYPVSNHTPPEHFQYLNTRQALADLPYFANNFSRPSYSHVDLTPKSTPWVMIGGSYPGARAAFARNEYPDTIFAAFAASAPVQAQINMSSYFDQVYRGMAANGLENCAKDLHAALEYIDDQLAVEDTARSLKQLFFGSGAEQNSNEDFTAALAGVYGYFQSHGVGGGEGGLSELCKHLELDPKTNKTAGRDGLAPAYGKQYVAERWAAWPVFTEVINFNMYTNCRGLDASTPPSCELNKPPSEPDAISWSWQYCSEWGFYQSNNVGVHSLLSRYQTLEFQQVQCERLFPEAVKSGLLPPQPRTSSLNEEFGGWEIRPSNVYFSAGEFDPWRTLSLLSTEDFAPQGVTVTTEIPKCGVKTGKDDIFGYVGPNSVHCFDFQTGTAAGDESRSYLVKALNAWLPCFQAQSGV